MTREMSKSSGELPRSSYTPGLFTDAQPPLSTGIGSSEITAPGNTLDVPGQTNDEPAGFPHVEQLPHLTKVDGIASQTATFFYRMYHKNVAAIGNVIAGQVAAGRPEGTPYRVLEPGCSRGLDTWSLASVLAARGIDFHIDSLDANEVMLARAHTPHHTDKLALSEHLQDWPDTPPEALDYFDEVAPWRVAPNGFLRAHVTFQRADITKPLPVTGAYDVAVVNNVLGYYAHDFDNDPPALHAIIGNISERLAVGGLFTFSDNWTRRPHEPVDLHGGWAEGNYRQERILEQHGLIPAENTYGIPDRQWQTMAIYQKTGDRFRLGGL